MWNSSTSNTLNQNTGPTTPPTTASPLEDFHFSSSQLLSLLHSKDDAIHVLKSDLMESLNKEVKSLDDDNWMFEGPRSRINLISKPGSYFSMKNSQPAKRVNFRPTK